MGTLLKHGKYLENYLMEIQNINKFAPGDVARRIIRVSHEFTALIKGFLARLGESPPSVGEFDDVEHLTHNLGILSPDGMIFFFFPRVC